MPAAAPVDKPYFPLTGNARDGWSNDEEATATCFCGAVQLKFPTQGPGIVETFVCYCADCRKITASMFASNFSIADTHLTHVRGRENLTAFGQSRTIGSGLPGMSILRIGTVDDFHLHETKLKPQRAVCGEAGGVTASLGRGQTG
ncbi:Mss4-like protein [Mycena pura]|uniref:Mss4-like protein n=1 Tax=Mycena pura TaxID=153505 RepID=A0AAD6VFM8_9AGAR|nr:Mss4-like protein [Mycena pura]